MPTYFNVDITVDRPGRCVVSTAAKDTLAEALSDAFSEATYYLGHHRHVHATISEWCRTCHGEGKITIRRPRSTITKDCKDCKAHHGPISTIAFPCVPSACVVQIDNGTGELVCHN